MIYVIAILLIFIFWAFLVWMGCDGIESTSICAIPTFLFLVIMYNVGFTEESRITQNKQNIINAAPVTTKTELGDGCALYLNYANGIKNFYTTKFVRCERSDVVTDRDYSCGKGKTCTEQISTKDTGAKNGR